MAVVKVVPNEDFAILRKYISGGTIVLISKDMADEIRKQKGIDFQAIDGDDLDYDHGGDADTWVDVVTNRDHYFVGILEERATPVDEES